MRDPLALKPDPRSRTSQAISLIRLRPAVTSGFWAMVDQSVFSLGNFLSTVTIGRFAGAKELGVYAFAMSLVFLTTAIQRALVMAPYTVHSQGLSAMQCRSRRGSALLQMVVVGGVLFPVLSVIAYFIFQIDPDSNVAAWLVVSAAATLGLRDFCRRVLFADHRFAESAVLDTAIVLAQLSLLISLAWAEQLTARTALFAISIASGIVAVCWFVYRQTDFSMQRDRIMPDARESWRFGRWVALSEATHAGQDSAVQALLAMSGSFETTGIYAACMSIVRLVNPAIQAVRNFAGPRSAQSLKRGGVGRLRRDVNAIARVLLAAMLVYLLVIVAGGDIFLAMLYGTAFADQHDLLIILSLAAIASALGMGPAKGLSAIERPQLNFLANAMGLFSVATLAWYSFESHQIYGVAVAILAGACVCSIAKWILFRSVACSLVTESTDQ